MSGEDENRRIGMGQTIQGLFGHGIAQQTLLVAYPKSLLTSFFIADRVLIFVLRNDDLPPSPPPGIEVSLVQDNHGHSMIGHFVNGHVIQH